MTSPGIIAASGDVAGGPQFAIPARIGVASTGGANSTSWATSFPQTPTEGSMMMLEISGGKASPVPTTPTGLTGWTHVGEGGGSSGAASGKMFLYARPRLPGDTWVAPTFGMVGTTTTTWTMEEISGLDLTHIPTGLAFTVSTNDSNTYQWTADAVNPEWGYCVAGGRCHSSGATNPVWSDASPLHVTNPARGAYSWTGFYLPSLGEVVDTNMTLTNVEPTNVNVVGVAKFRRKAL